MSKQLTKAEEQIMQVLWELNEASVKEVIDKLPIPKPAYNTVSTIIRILETKEFVRTYLCRKRFYLPSNYCQGKL